MPDQASVATNVAATSPPRRTDEDSALVTGPRRPTFSWLRREATRDHAGTDDGMFGLRPAPELCRPGLEWFNVDRPLTMADLRGRLVIIDFWTACCVNCLNVQQTLRRITAAFAADAVVVIGVHSPKFPHEREAEAVAHALARHDIRHPVVHDPDMLLWGAYGIRGWPTLVFVGPDGKVLGDLPGEPDEEKLLSGIGQMVQGWRCPGSEARAPLPLARPHPDGTANGRLRYPTKIKPVSSPGGRRWVCADSGHHQVVLLDDDGGELRRFGCGRPGFIDLGEGDSAFDSPQGLIANGCFVYVADTNNHAIRRIDIDTGIGDHACRDGHAAAASWRGPRRGRRRRWPRSGTWRCAARSLFFANAGTHQLGVLDLDAGTVRPCAGSGQEDLVDGAAGDRLPGAALRRSS